MRDVLQALLDLRDVLREIAVGISEIRTNTETLAIRAETLLPAEFRAEPPFVAVVEHTRAESVNQMISDGWILLGATVDSEGVSHYTLAKRAERPNSVGPKGKP